MLATIGGNDVNCRREDLNTHEKLFSAIHEDKCSFVRPHRLIPLTKKVREKKEKKKNRERFYFVIHTVHLIYVYIAIELYVPHNYHIIQRIK